MSTKRGKNSKKRESFEKVETEEKIQFSIWFAQQARSKNVFPWQAKELMAFFKGHGLSEKETEDKYSELLKLY